jgi:1-phosphofructokinase
VTNAIVTVTLNPAIDRTVWLDRLVPGRTHRSTDTRATIGGKGINVARTVSRLATPVFALGIAGEDQSASIEQHLASLGVQARFLATPGETRTNLKVVEQGTGRLTEINGSGPVVSPELVASLETELLATVTRTEAGAVVLAGSLPLGIDSSVYARWTRRLQNLDRPVRVLVDASDDVLAQAVAAQPFFVKPNRVEAEGLLGRSIGRTEEAVAAAVDIQRLGAQAVLLSLGSMGAVACTKGETDVIAPRPVGVPHDGLLTTVGAGDAMVARIAVEVARVQGGEIEPAAFFAMCRSAVAEAEQHIAAGSQAAVETGGKRAGVQDDVPSGSWQLSAEHTEAPMTES